MTPSSGTSSATRDKYSSILRLLFVGFKNLYRMLAATPLRRVPGMLNISNAILGLIWRSPQIELQGVKMYINMSDPNPAIRKAFQAYILNRIHEPATTELFKKYVKPGSVVVDAGANLGYFSLLAASLAGPNGRVISFEPEPRNFWYLSKNVEINNFAKITPIKKALSDKNGKTELFICGYDCGHHTINQIGGIEAIAHGRAVKEQTVEIETVRLDDALRDLGVSNVDVVKVDVEGAEALALDGMRGVLSQDKLTVFMEYFPLLIEKMGNDPKKFIESLLSDFSFSMYIIGEDYDAGRSESGLTQIKSYGDLAKLVRVRMKAT